MPESLSQQALALIQRMREYELTEKEFIESVDRKEELYQQLFHHTLFALSQLPRTDLYLLSFDLSNAYSYENYDPWKNLEDSERWNSPWIMKIDGNNEVPAVIVTHAAVSFDEDVDIFTELASGNDDSEIGITGQFGLGRSTKKQYIFFEEGNPKFRNNLFYLANLILDLDAGNDNIEVKEVASKAGKRKTGKSDSRRPTKVYLSLTAKGQTFYTRQRRETSEKRNLLEMEKIEVNIEPYRRRKDASRPPTEDNLIQVRGFPSHRYIKKADREIVIKP
jgi:hypothetical protein